VHGCSVSWVPQREESRLGDSFAPAGPGRGARLPTVEAVKGRGISQSSLRDGLLAGPLSASLKKIYTFLHSSIYTGLSRNAFIAEDPLRAACGWSEDAEEGCVFAFSDLRCFSFLPWDCTAPAAAGAVRRCSSMRGSGTSEPLPAGERRSGVLPPEGGRWHRERDTATGCVGEPAPNSPRPTHSSRSRGAGR